MKNDKIRKIKLLMYNTREKKVIGKTNGLISLAITCLFLSRYELLV